MTDEKKLAGVLSAHAGLLALVFALYNVSETSRRLGSLEDILRAVNLPPGQPAPGDPKHAAADTELDAIRARASKLTGMLRSFEP